MAMRHFRREVTWCLVLACHWLMTDGCFTSQQTSMMCECKTEPRKFGDCFLDATVSGVPEITRTDLTFKELIIRGGTIRTIKAGDFAQLDITTLTLDGVTVEKLDIGAFSSLGNKLYNLHLVDNSLNVSSFTSGAFDGLPQLGLLNITDNNIDPLSGLFQKLTNLQKLYLADNGITQIADNSFSQLQNLRTLDLSDNVISSVSGPTFSGLENLKVLSLRNNNITSINKDLFTMKGRLQTLELGDNGLTSIPEDAFSRLLGINKILLANNMITSLPPKVFEFNSLLEEIDVGNNSLRSVHVDTFIYQQRLQSIILHRNNISSVSADIFFRQKSLLTIDLTHNLLDDLDKTTFRDLTKLQRLFLGHNQIKLLDADLLRDLYVLVTLDLEYNSIEVKDVSGEYLPFRNQGRLAYLYLQGNRISRVPDNIFSGLEALKQLNLSNNGVLALAGGGLRSLATLTHLYLSDNRLTTLPPGAFSPTPALRFLHLSGNPLAGERVDPIYGSLPSLRGLYLARCDVTTVSPDAFNNITGLSFLDLSQNALQLTGAPFRALPELSYLFLHSSRLASLPAEVFGGIEFSKLTLIDLNSNDLTSLPSGLFQNVTSNVKIDLSFNKLTSLEGGVFGNAPAVQSVDLRNNEIRCINPTFADSLPHLAVFMVNNSFVCDCNLAWLRDQRECSNALGLCIRDVPRCANVDADVYSFRSTACSTWRCPAPYIPPKPAASGADWPATWRVASTLVMTVLAMFYYY